MPQKIEVFKESVDYLATVFPIDSKASEIFAGLVDNSNSADLSQYLLGSFFAVLKENRPGLKVVHVTDQKNHPVLALTSKVRTVQGLQVVERSIDFYGWFWTSYASMFPIFCEFLGLDVYRQGLVRRVDYCIDLLGVNVQAFRDSIIKDTVTVSELTPTKGVSVHGSPTWYRFTNSTSRVARELVAYDKKLDILDKGKHRFTNNAGQRPFAEYLELPDNLDVTRLEYRLRSHGVRELSDNSIRGILDTIRPRSWDFVHKHFGQISKVKISKPAKGQKPFVIQRARNLKNAQKNVAGVVSSFIGEW